MADEMLAAIDLLTMELGAITDGDGNELADEAVIHFREDADASCEIVVRYPNAKVVAEKIVQTWNDGRKVQEQFERVDTGLLIQHFGVPTSRARSAVAALGHLFRRRVS